MYHCRGNKKNRLYKLETGLVINQRRKIKLNGFNKALSEELLKNQNIIIGLAILLTLINLTTSLVQWAINNLLLIKTKISAQKLS